MNKVTQEETTLIKFIKKKKGIEECKESKMSELQTTSVWEGEL